MEEVVTDVEQGEQFIEADLNYLVDNGERPVTYTYEPPEGIAQRTGDYRLYRVRIANARVNPPPGGLSLDRNGFEFHTHASAVSDFSDPDRIERDYYPESEALLKRATGAQKVVIFDHTLRDGQVERRVDGVREPVKYVHNDQTFVSGPRRVRDHLPEEEARRRLEARFAIVNVWRPIGEPVESTPLALCDSRSILRSDVVASDLVYRDKVGETYAFKFNRAHRWFYLPRQRSDEVSLIKIYDSDDRVQARFTAHTAFDDPNTPVDARPRRSIELFF